LDLAPELGGARDEVLVELGEVGGGGLRVGELQLQALDLGRRGFGRRSERVVFVAERFVLFLSVP
jgi:hypothetical protein